LTELRFNFTLDTKLIMPGTFCPTAQLAWYMNVKADMQKVNRKTHNLTKSTLKVKPDVVALHTFDLKTDLFLLSVHYHSSHLTSSNLISTNLISRLLREQGRFTTHDPVCRGCDRSQDT